MITIFPVEAETDIDLVRGLFEEYLATWFGHKGPMHDNELEAFREQIRHLPGCFGPPEGNLLLGKYGDEAAGCVALRRSGDCVCEMKRLYVRPAFRGLKIGRGLSEAIIEDAKIKGYSAMRIQTISPLEAANGLYGSLGFVEIAPYEYCPRDDAVFLELKLV
jgi:GNAT superfamily N-acetyltransferase